MWGKAGKGACEYISLFSPLCQPLVVSEVLTVNVTDAIYMFPPDESSLVLRQLAGTGTAMPICSARTGGWSTNTPSQGYWFTLPIDIQIIGLNLLAISGFLPDTQSVQVITSDSDFPFTTNATDLRTVGRSEVLPYQAFLKASTNLYLLFLLKVKPMDRSSARVSTCPPGSE